MKKLKGILLMLPLIALFTWVFFVFWSNPQLGGRVILGLLGMIFLWFGGWVFCIWLFCKGWELITKKESKSRLKEA